MVKRIGWHLASVLSLFNFDDLKLVHGQISLSTIYLKRKGDFEVRMVDFSKAFYLDEERIQCSPARAARGLETSLEHLPLTMTSTSKYMSPELSAFMSRSPNQPQ